MAENYQIAAYSPDRPLKEHEKRMLQLVAGCIDCGLSTPLRILDIGSAYGVFTQKLAELNPAWQINGIDINDGMIKVAQEKFGADRLSFSVADATDYPHDPQYDLIIASGVLAIFEDSLAVIDYWLSTLAEGGRLFIFTALNSAPIDRFARFRNRVTTNEWEGGFTGYAVDTIREHLKSKKYTHRFVSWSPDFDIPKGDDPVRDYTVTTSDGRRMLVNGAGIVHEFYFVIIEK